VPGAPVAALTERDAGFIAAQLENNMAVVLAARRALEHSQNSSVRGFAQKMITDHNYAQSTLEPIASMHHIQAPTTLSDPHREMLNRLSQLSGPAFDREYVNSMVNEHALEISAYNTAGKTQRRIVSAWVGTAFAQDDAATARKQWRHVADELRPRVSKLATLMDDAEADVLAYMGFPAQHRAKIHSTNPIERLNGEIKRRSDVVGIFPNEAEEVQVTNRNPERS